MTTSVITPSGKTLGSRHNSHNNLVTSDSVSDWLNGSSHNNTPKGPTIMNTHDSLHRQDSFASLTDGFDIVSPPMLTWSNTAESKIIGLNSADDYLSNLVEHSIDLKSTFTSTLHVDDFFHEDMSNSSSPNMGTTTINLPGWNHGPEVMGGLFDSDVDSPEGIWYGQTQNITSKAARRGPDMPSFSINIERSDSHTSPGASNPVGFETLNPPPTSGMPGLLGAPARALRSSISAPLLQRDDPVLEAAGSQNLINDYLVDVGYPQDRIPDSNALGLELGSRSSAVSSPAQDTAVQGTHTASSKDSTPLASELSSGSSVAPQSALFQRRAEQRDLLAPSPVAVLSADNSPALGAQVVEVAPTVNNAAESNIDPKDMTEGQRRRLAQLHQIHVAQQAARLGVYQDFVAPSQQFAGQEASERAAKSVQAALLYGMEGNSPRKLSMGSTGLPTPVTPQHPLQPAPGTMAHHLQTQAYLTGYAGADLTQRSPGMPLSADSANFAPSIQNQFSNLHLAQQSPQQQQQGIFTPQFLHQNDTTLFAGAGNAASQGMSGYTSVYPPARHNSISGSSSAGNMLGLTLTASGVVGASGPLGGDQMLMSRRATIVGGLRASESSPSLASQIAANPMQLQNPFGQQQVQQQQVMATLEPAKLISASGTGLVPPASSTPRSAPADASREHLALQQTRMRQLQQQQLQFLQMQNQAVQQQQAASKQLGGQVITRKAPNMLSAPLSPPRSPAKMKSTPHLRSPLGGIMAGLPPSPSKQPAQGLRKIASNRRITLSAGTGGSSTGSSSSSSSSAGGPTLKPRSSTIGSVPGFTMELTTSASPTRARTISHSSVAPSRSNSSPGKSKSPPLPPLPSSSKGFSALSFVNYGMDDADEICSAVAPSGSYKVPLRGFGASSGEEDEFDDDLSAPRPRTASNVTGTMGSDDDVDSPGSTFAFGGVPGSPTKKVRKNSSRPNLIMPGSPLKSKRSMANLGGAGGRAWDLTRSPRKTKSTILSPVP
ncbi:hypothetical protein PSEUBRA_000782 [Kalmanozyma brasiliensis GHG001]|uniref:Uncharacterized protein n=1 Tax=Kalmanozyma brasiliensis (strain GHG001) TaxID=1365824 RepID=V5EVR5_KALBG|nr:uncharacterized protein PSEUBRA_000782 [Kalmanozyma brasiliensis GHG001]EST09565.1 hypothetical protein PSEUBRA_000782 [Kalmanozyma brasiliensis GHG001]